MSKMIHFFATREELLSVLTEIESEVDIHYAEAGMFEIPEVVKYSNSKEIPDLGVSKIGYARGETMMLIGELAREFSLRESPQRRGGVRYAVDQLYNPHTVSLAPGGLFDARTVIAGDIGTCTTSPISVNLFKVCKKIVRRRWNRIHSYYVSNEAEKILDAGGRLTADVKSPAEYDVQRNA